MVHGSEGQCERPISGNKKFTSTHRRLLSSLYQPILQKPPFKSDQILMMSTSKEGKLTPWKFQVDSVPAQHLGLPLLIVSCIIAMPLKWLYTQHLTSLNPKKMLVSSSTKQIAVQRGYSSSMNFRLIIKAPSISLPPIARLNTFSP